ncbi:allophanate hydrolase [Pokkaliibacter plantistimulans]|uniref:Allophanate hydrolase n=1 Tax=Proteobacteria bacterium 228 TaxID=2083153 RepID=A0A2S5KPJ4_9PROT|nr:biotin-dependent carboxyltransferase family protein [Pokkaliibacter plantistimulans]PPC76698.1 allophanate hydrolase [Pokkaliibacter plantistimulans]
MSFEVISSGVLTLLQDGGRFGYQHIGITSGGPMDEHAAYWANHLLGNPVRAAALEITYGMLTLEARADTSFALTGADLGATLDGEAITPWRTYQIRSGSQLAFSTPERGFRAYLAVPGGFAAPERLGSCATVVREGIGGLDGQGGKLVSGDVLPFTPRLCADTEVPDHAIPDYVRPLEVLMVPGYQYAEFSRTEQAKFFASSYTITQNIDRMGYRLSGSAVKSSRTGIISEGIAYGAIQVPSDGQPIVLLKDRQTIGGYPKMGCTTSLAAGQLAQRGPGAEVCFTPVSLEAAEAQRLLFERQFS